MQHVHKKSGSSSSHTPLFSIKHLSFAYPARPGEKSRGGHKVFSDFSVDIREGLVTTILGANGSGKTTLFDLMCKNLEAQRGSISLRGVDISRLRLRDFAQLVAIVHQHNRAPRDISIRELVAYGRHPYHEDLRLRSKENVQRDSMAVDRAIRLCSLEEIAAAPVTALSGGQAQRVWIAMALAQETKVLLLDEPTTYLDVRYQLEILALIRKLNRELGMSVIMVIHDINQAIHYSHELIALEGGSLAAQGAPEEIVNAELMRRVYGIDMDVITIRDKPYVMAI